ncbi:hypothetical protein [Pseudomonas sp. SWRI77]|jgi:hypothetical protein|uniref:hypothetical protein n=1 Tax=Pseudomonas sp. SWRI77 TaxID=2745485 RepID=UPI001EE18EDC|nr:hypothetical protein [Pseudomonas sp. SWRI77]
MPAKIKLIQSVAVERDENGWWHHPGIPDFCGIEDPAPYKAWTAEQGLELKTWDMDADLDYHPYFDGEAHCNGWEPESPGPEWFLMGIFDTEDGPHVQWARRKTPEQCGACGGCSNGCQLDKDSPVAQP